LPWKEYMLRVNITDTYLNIIAAAQGTELSYQSSSTMNAVISVLAFRKYFVC